MRRAATGLAPSRGDGICWRGDIRYGPLRYTDIKDGDSNTFMIGEDVPELIEWNAWAYSNGCTGTCAIPPNLIPGPACILGCTRRRKLCMFFNRVLLRQRSPMLLAAALLAGLPGCSTLVAYDFVLKSDEK